MQHSSFQVGLGLELHAKFWQMHLAYGMIAPILESSTISAMKQKQQAHHLLLIISFD
jgi:hypothetical protein